ncbi:MAG: hypothetical protein HXS48_01725 [Theionarchaea archaeon]|nr:hypothetical protein [Theionarchaea archaeon]
MKKTWLIVCIFLFASVYGQDIPLSQTVELKNYEDHYELEKFVPIYQKEDGTCTTEYMVVSVDIAPKEYSLYQDKEMKEYFSNIFVYITISTEDGDTSEEFQSYLNFDTSEGRLFWDHAGQSRADRAGETFGQDNSLIVKDEYVEVTLALTQLNLSDYRCDGCDSDAASYIFIDLIRFKLVIDYSQSQKDSIEECQEDIERYGDAQEHITKAKENFQQGEFKKAKDEFQKAKDIFDEIGDTEKSDDMREQIDKCTTYQVATENFKDGMDLFEDAASTNDYQEAIDMYEQARSYFQRAKTEFDRAEDTNKSDECETMIDRCNDGIDDLKDVGTLRGRLIYIILAIVVMAVAGVVIKQLGKGKPPKQVTKGITLKAKNAETGEETTIQVEATDKIGKVRQMAATNLGVIPSELLYNGKACPPDWTVQECGLRNGAVVTVVPRGAEPPRDETEVYDRKEKLEKLEQRYREGRISKELYETLKRKLESD